MWITPFLHMYLDIRYIYIYVYTVLVIIIVIIPLYEMRFCFSYVFLNDYPKSQIWDPLFLISLKLTACPWK